MLNLALSLLVLAQGVQYPLARKSDHMDDYNGVKVADPYRWLENSDSAETRVWINEENVLTQSYISAIPERPAIRARFKSILNYEKYGQPFKKAGMYFYTKNSGLQNQSPLYVTKSLTAPGRMLIDPNKMSKSGFDPIGGYTVSDDGKYLAYSKSSGGSDWQEWFVRDIKTGKDTKDHIQWSKFSGCSWSRDSKGFYYSRYEAPKPGTTLQGQNYFQKLYYHKLGTPQSKDVLVYSRQDHKDWGFGGDVTEDGRYLTIGVWKGTDPNNAFFYKDLREKGQPVHQLLNKWDAQYEFLGNEGSVFWFKTDNKAPRKRIIAIDIRKPETANWKTLIPQAKESLESATVVGNRFICVYLRDAKSVARLFKFDGKPAGIVALPGIGTASGFGGERKDKETFYTFTSFTVPRTLYRYDLTTAKSSIFKKPNIDFDSSKFATRQVFYTSKDGTRVPMFITYKRGIKLTGANPTLLYGYGGFDASETPFFSTSNVIWLEMGGVYCLANIRGGGEYGKEWHEGGMKKNKQNVFDDFIAAAEWLIAEKYTSSDKLAIEGGSNGGLLVGACMTQRPDLFGACLPAVGVMDMLRFNKFTIGWAWQSDYGNPDKPDDFEYIYKYSPLHNITAGTQYPATLVTTADHDDRVVPAHSFKFTAALQAAQAGPAPILIRIETQAGHGTVTTEKIIEQQADKWAFLVKALNISVPVGFGQ